MPLPSHFESASEWADEDDIAEQVVCGSDPEALVNAISELAERELLPRLADLRG